MFWLDFLDRCTFASCLIDGDMTGEAHRVHQLRTQFVPSFGSLHRLDAQDKNNTRMQRLTELVAVHVRFRGERVAWPRAVSWLCVREWPTRHTALWHEPLLSGCRAGSEHVLDVSRRGDCEFFPQTSLRRIYHGADDDSR